MTSPFVIPAQAGIQSPASHLDSRLRENDENVWLES